MWMHDISIGQKAVSEEEFVEKYLDQVSEPEYMFFKKLLRVLFVKSKCLIICRSSEKNKTRNLDKKAEKRKEIAFK